MQEGGQEMQFQKGQSGNPAGRPRGARNRASVLVHSLLEAKAEALACKTIAMAEEGNIVALRMCMDRIAPARKLDPGSCDLPPLDNPAAPVEAMARIADAVATGNLATSEAVELAQVVEIYLHALAAKGFDERLTKVEEMALSNREPESGRTIQLPSTRS
jgi:hypothetical protein